MALPYQCGDCGEEFQTADAGHLHIENSTSCYDLLDENGEIVEIDLDEEDEED